MKSPIVSVIIPNYRGEHLLPKHLPHVCACLESGDEIIIVDDASPDGSVGWLINQYSLKKQGKSEYIGKWRFKKNSGPLKVLVNAHTVRFAATCNRGVAAAVGSFIFLLNNDVSPLASCRTVLLEACQNQKVFAVGCLEYEDRVGGTESGKNVLWFEKGLFFHSRASAMDSGRTAWVSGGSGMFRKSVWQELGGFDTAFAPAYWEDIDLSHRARALGYSVLFNRDAAVLHQHETTNKKTFDRAALLSMSWKSADMFTRKHGSLWQLMQYYLWRPFWWWQRRKVLRHG